MDTNEQGFTADFLEDQDLLERHRAGDPSAYGALFAKHRKRALAYAHKYAHNKDQAEDLVIEAFTKILGTIQRGNGPTISMGHYLATTIRTIALNISQREEQELALDPQDVAEMYEREHFLEHEDDSLPISTAGWLADAFNSLGAREQEVLWFRAVEEMPSQEIAQRLGVSPATITRSYQAAARELRERFVALSIAAAPNPNCQQYVPQLLRLARAPATQDTNEHARAGDSLDKAFKAHAENCPTCGTIASRLGSSDRVLLSIVLLAGLGALGADALRSPTPAEAASWPRAGIPKPIKIALLAVPVIAAVATAGFLSSLAYSHANEVEMSLGDGTAGSPSAVLEVGSCQLTRVPLGGHTELWRLEPAEAGGGSDCQARVENPAAGGVLLDTAVRPTVRATEITQPGRYSVTVSDGTDRQSLSVVAGG